VEELLAERGVDVPYETVRRWVLKFGPVGRCGPSEPKRQRNGRTPLQRRELRPGLAPFRADVRCRDKATGGISATSSRRGCDRLPASNIYAPYRNCVLPKSIRAVNPAGRLLDAAAP
jgi:hypothetical protein